jgi:hypothetical protein
MQRLGIFVGPAATVGLGYPDWNELRRRVAEELSINIVSASGPLAHTYSTMLLYEHFRTAFLTQGRRGDQSALKSKYELEAGWRELLHRCLYRNVPTGPEEFLSRAGYLQTYVPVMRAAEFTISYGFGDALEKLLSITRSSDEQERTRGYATVDQPDVRFYPRKRVIYHPNGSLPSDLRDHPSRHFAFPEDAPIDGLVNNTGHFSSLCYHMSRCTWLLLGVGLQDPTLRHVLRLGARTYPGHFQCLIVPVEANDVPNGSDEALVTRANFANFNVLTMFLTHAEISALGEMIVMEPSEFADVVHASSKPAVYRFYVTGSVSVGKSTSVSYFRNVRTLDEWLDRRAAGMEKDFKKLGESEVEAIDRWVAKQWSAKNSNVMQGSEGITLVDRAPLDAFAFTELDLWNAKAELLRTTLEERSGASSLVPAHILLLVGDPDVMAIRSIARHKDMDATSLAEQQQLLREVYRGGGVTEFFTTGKSIHEVVKELAWTIFVDQTYEEFPLQKFLTEFEQTGYPRYGERPTPLDEDAATAASHGLPEASG